MDPMADDEEEGVASQEIEVKLFVPPASVERIGSHPLIAEHAIGPCKVARLHTRYVDTPARELAVHGMALRLRRRGRRWVQTLKSDAGGGAVSVRGEWETAVAGPALELGRLRGSPLATLGSPRALAKRLQPVFTTDFRRESRMVRLPDGSTAEFAFDRGVVATGRGRARRTSPICEVEIELKERASAGAEEALLRFAARLARDVPLIPLAATKAARGYQLADGIVAGPVKVALPPPAPGDDASAHLARVVDACNAAMLANAHALFESAASQPGGNAIEFVHQARVAMRRLRSALHTFRPIVSGRRIVALDDALRTIGQGFGDARDWDVLSTASERLDAEVGRDDAGRAALADVRSMIHRRREAAHGALMRLLDEGSFGATAIATQRFAMRIAAWTSVAIDGCAPRWLEKQRDRVVAQARRIAILDDAARHRLRVEVKRLRYALDLLQPLYDEKAAAAFGDALADLQNRLGRLNDAVVAQTLLRSLPPNPSLDLVLSRYEGWLAQHVRKQLPKIGALSVAFELTPQPWKMERARAFGIISPARPQPEPSDP